MIWSQRLRVIFAASDADSHAGVLFEGKLPLMVDRDGQRHSNALDLDCTDQQATSSTHHPWSREAGHCGVVVLEREAT